MRTSRFFWKDVHGRHSLEISRTGGALDHYFHFILDLVWPLFHWKEGLHAFGPDTELQVLEPAELHFAEAMETLLGLRMTLAKGPAPGDAVTPVRLHGSNPRNGDHLQVFGSAPAFAAGRMAFAEALAQRWQVVKAASPTVVLIERTVVPGDRGGSRRRIAEHRRLAEELVPICAMAGTAFRNVVLEELDIRQQFELFHGGPVLLIGQHGAGLVNGIWMTHPRSAVIELAAADNPAHFQRLFPDLGMAYQRLEFPGTGAFMDGQMLRVDAKVLRRGIEDWAGRP